MQPESAKVDAGRGMARAYVHPQCPGQATNQPVEIVPQGIFKCPSYNL